MKKLTATLLLACALAGAGHHPAAAPAPAAATELTEGEIRKVDKEAGKLTIKHEAIKNLDMPAMTMVFHVRDRNLLDKVQAGDKVRFRAEAENGKYLATDIQPAKPL